MFNPRARKSMGFLGIFGFLGILGYLFQEPSGYIFFSFFGFFGFFWEAKLNQEKPDERLKENFHRAHIISYRVGLLFVWLSLILLTRLSSSFEGKYSIIVIAISLSFALSIFLVPFLTYRFDKKDSLDDY